MCANFTGYSQSLVVGDGLHLPRAESVGRRAVVAQVKLGAYQDDWDAGCVVFDLWVPLCIGKLVG